jgi:type II secretory pathway predicted ATPase ExeA
MYEEFFDLQNRPFIAAAQVERYFPAAAIETARKTITRCIERAEGTALLMGSSGTGKTLLCEVLAQQLGDRFQTAMLTCGHLGTRKALLQAVLFALDQPFRDMDEGYLRLTLVDYLMATSKASQGLVLLIDEAHTLSWRLLEELRLITNLAVAGQPRVRVVLCGNGSLEESFANPKLDSFSQRVAARCYLGSFNRAETAAYVRHQIGVCGGNADAIVSREALESVHQATDGIPRLINQVCDHALILANVAGKNMLHRGIIEEAWADLQQLPAPWSGDADEAAESNVVEFGDLDDTQDESPEAIPFRRSERNKPDIESQLNSIDSNMAQLDEDFRPAGSIGFETGFSRPLVEIDNSNPFDEEFAEEEVVLDRFAAIETSIFAGLPSVISSESHGLATELAAAARTVEPALRVRESEDWPAAEEAAESNHTSEFFAMPLSSKGAAVTPARNIAAAAPEAPALQKSPDPAPAVFGRGTVTPALVQSRPSPAAEAADDLDDRDMIVIEEDAPSVVAPMRPSALVRRQEYRQLFAKLRRG